MSETSKTIVITGSYDSETAYYVGDTAVIPFEATLPPDDQISGYDVTLEKQGESEETWNMVERATLVDTDEDSINNAISLTNLTLEDTSDHYRIKLVKKTPEDTESEDDSSPDTPVYSAEFKIAVESNTASLETGDIQVNVTDTLVSLSIQVNSVHNDLQYSWKNGITPIGSTARVDIQRVEWDSLESAPTITLELKANRRRGTYKLTKELSVLLTDEQYRKPKPAEEEPEERGDTEDLGTHADYAGAEEATGFPKLFAEHYQPAAGEQLVSAEGARVTMGLTQTKVLPENVRATYSWKKNDQPANEFNEAAIILIAPTVNDTGKYELTVTLHKDQEEESKVYTFNLTVSRTTDTDEEEGTESEDQASTPAFDLSQTNLGIVHEGDSITLSVENPPEGASIQWYGKNIEGADVPLLDQTTSRLQINANPSVAKGIFARATSSAGVKDSPIAEIVTFKAATITVTSEEKIEAHDENGQFEYSIQVAPNDEYTNIRWLYESKSGVVAPLTAFDNHLTISVNPLTLNDAGDYYAVVSRLDAASVRSARYHLTVREVEAQIEFGIKLDKPSKVTLATGQIFNIVAKVTNTSDRTEFQWYKKTHEGTTAVRGQTTPVLTINDIAEDDTGHYQLVVKQGISQTSSDWVYLDVVERPMSSAAVGDVEKVLQPSEDEAVLNNRKYPEEIVVYAGALEKYCGAMYVGKAMEPKEGVLNQVSFYRNLVQILNIEDHNHYMAAMDMVVDYFWAYRETVFRLDLRSRFFANITERFMSEDEIEAFGSLMSLFVYMADPINNVPQSPKEIGDVIDGVAWARFTEYFARKVETNKQATLLSSAEWLSSQTV